MSQLDFTVSEAAKAILNEINNQTPNPESPVQLVAEIVDGVIVVRDEVSQQAVVLSSDGDQVICMTTLFKASDVAEDKVAEMHEFMLKMNMPLRLSTFGLMGEDYMLFGAMHKETPAKHVIEEVECLLLNSESVIEPLSQFLSA